MLLELGTRHRRLAAALGIFVTTLLAASCADPAADSVILSADLPLHLEDHLDKATIEGSEVPDNLPQPVEWRFDEPQSEWKPIGYVESRPVRLTQLEDALRLDITDANYFTSRTGLRPHDGYIYIDVPDLSPEDWGYVSVRARSQSPISSVLLLFNLTDRSDPSETPASGFSPPGGWPFRYDGDEANLIRDGSEHTYLLEVGRQTEDWDEPWKQLGLRFFAGWQPERVPASIDILSVSLIPRDAAYADADVGVAPTFSGSIQRRALYTHSPARLEYRVRVPEGGRFDVGLGVVRDDAPVHFTITVRPPGGDAVTLLEETYSGSDWAQRSLDLTRFEGETVSLVLSATSDRVGAVGLWVGPTLSGSRNTRKPNIIVYVIDSAGADFMSVYGYNRRTTPYLERLAAEGAIFEHTYSNSSYTRASTRSFVTSLHDSVLGGKGGGLPEEAKTMAQHMRAGGYQTAMFTSNSNAGSATDRGVDTYRDTLDGVNSASSVQLHQDYWNWRNASPGEPYWVHFQTTDVHAPFHPPAPFAGLFTSPELRETYYRWDSQLRSAGGTFDLGNYDAAGVDRVAHAHAEQGLYDETMDHNDYQIGRLVERLKAAGEWEHTLLIVASDHGYPGASPRRLDPMPPAGQWALLRPHVTRVPLIVVWPERIAPGQRFSDPVSVIDLLPTILDLAGLPKPEIMQGQSLAPLLLEKDGWEPQPVIFDEFYPDPTSGQLNGWIEVIDGRWGASLQISPNPEMTVGGAARFRGRPAPLLLYDLSNDPHALNSLHEERPDLVEHYTAFLEAQWEAHQALAQKFTPGEESPLTPGQLQTLRSLGYIQ